MSGDECEYEYSDVEERADSDVEERADDAKVSLENAYYNSKGLRETDLNAAAASFESVIAQEQECLQQEGSTKKYGPWSCKAMKQLFKLHMRAGNDQAMISTYHRLLRCIGQGDVSPNHIEKGINGMLECVASLHHGRGGAGSASTTDGSNNNNAMDPQDIALQVYNATLTEFHPKTGTCQNERLWFKTNIKYGQLLFEMNDTATLQQVVRDLQSGHQENNNNGSGDSSMDDGAASSSSSSTQKTEIFALQIQLYSLLKNDELLRKVVHKAMAVRDGVPCSRTRAVIQEYSGKMRMASKDYEVARKAFFQAFMSHDEAEDSTSSSRCLKYLALAHMLQPSTMINPFALAAGHRYRNDIMAKLVDAFQKNNLIEFETILCQNENDGLICNHVQDLLRAARTKVLSRLLDQHDDDVVPLQSLAVTLNVTSVQEVEPLVRRLIHIGSLHAEIHSAAGCLIKSEQPQVPTNPKRLLAELKNARAANDFERLEFLLKNNRDENGREIVDDGHIYKLLNDAVRDDTNGVGVCRLFLKALSDAAQQQDIRMRYTCILCVAVGSGDQEKIEFFLYDCDFDKFVNEEVGAFRPPGAQQNDETPLHVAVRSQRNTTATCRLLLEHGANAKEDRLLVFALLHTANNTVAFEVTRLLLQYGADPKKADVLSYAVDKNNAPVAVLFMNDYGVKPSQIHIGKAISEGKEDVLSTFLQHDACPVPGYDTTSLNTLLSSDDHTRQTKRNICRILIEHANSNHANSEAMMKYIYATLVAKANHGQGHFVTGQGHCEILVDAGMDPTRALGKAVDAKHASLCRWLVQDHGADPYHGKDEESSPFCKAACLKDTTIFNYFSSLWEHRFSNSINDEGNHALHEICCENKSISLQAIKAIVPEEQSTPAPKCRDVLPARNQEGYVPVLLAAKADAHLDVIYYLLKKCPAALINKDNVRPSKDALDAQIASLQAKVDSQQDEIEKLRAANKKLRATRDPQEEPANKKAKMEHY